MKLLRSALRILLASSVFAGAKACTSATGCDCSVTPDPHFKTWDDIYYDYHGGCDLVLIDSTNVNLHIRTKPVFGYSYVEKASLEIGGDILVVYENATYTFSGSTPFVIGTYTWSISTPSYGTTFEVILPAGQYIRLGTYSSGGIYINANANDGSTIFAGAEGMCGDFDNGLLRDRASMDLVTNGTAAADAWLWQSALDPQLLGDSANVAACDPPMGFDRGCVGRECEMFRQDRPECVECLMEGDAEAACRAEGVAEGPMLMNCIFDVETTGDKATWSQAVFYQEPVAPQCLDSGGSACRDRGGECVLDCKASLLGPKCEVDLCNGSGSGCACKLDLQLSPP